MCVWGGGEGYIVLQINDIFNIKCLPQSQSLRKKLSRDDEFCSLADNRLTDVCFKAEGL